MVSYFRKEWFSPQEAFFTTRKIISLKCESIPRLVNAFAPGRNRSYKAKTKMSTLSSCSTSNPK